MDKNGFTLVEIIIAALIMALITAGLANLFISGKRFILHSRSRMTAGELGRYFLDPLQMDVNQSKWGSNCLSTGTPANCSDQTATGMDRDYNATYNVTPNSPITNLNKVIVNITWYEPTP